MSDLNPVQDEISVDLMATALRRIHAAIDRERPTPLYEQAAAALRLEIGTGSLPAGAALPTEPDLARAMGLSRPTVAQALGLLVDEGVLKRTKGVGTFVTRPALEHPLGSLSSFVHTLSENGRPPQIDLLGLRVTVDSSASRLLTGSEHELVFEISRLFGAADEPVLVERVFLTVANGTALPPDRVRTGIIDQLLRDFAGVNVNRGRETLRLTYLDRTDASVLRQRAGSAAIEIERVAFADGIAVELRRSVVRGDRARFTVELAGEPLIPVVDSGDLTLDPRDFE